MEKKIEKSTIFCSLFSNKANLNSNKSKRKKENLNVFF